LDVWQVKGLRVRFSDVWQGKDLAVWAKWHGGVKQGEETVPT